MNKTPRTFKFSVRVRGCDQVFADGMEPGEIMYQEVVYQLTDEDLKHPMFAKALSDKEAEVIKEAIEVIITPAE